MESVPWNMEKECKENQTDGKLRWLTWTLEREGRGLESLNAGSLKNWKDKVIASIQEASNILVSIQHEYTEEMNSRIVK